MRLQRRLRPSRLALGLSVIAFAAGIWLAAAPIRELRLDLSDVQLAAVPEIAETGDRSLEGSAATIIMRPLFIEGRKPSTADGSGARALGELRLAGTISTANVRKALFREATESGRDSKGRWVGVGEEVAGWRIVAVESGRATLVRGGEQIILSISKRKALTPKQVSQARAATPILPSALSAPTQAEIDARAEKLKEALSKLGDSGIYGTPN